MLKETKYAILQSESLGSKSDQIYNITHGELTLGIVQQSQSFK